MGILDKVLGQQTAPTTAATADTEKDPVLAVLPPGVRERVRAKRERDAAVKAGEDPRITEFYKQSEAQKTALSVLPSAVRERVQTKAAERSREQFFQANPDLDPRVQERLAKETVKVKDKTVPAEQAVQDILRILAAPEAIADAEGRRTGTWTSAEQTRKRAIDDYNRIKDQLTPQQRARFGLDELEAQGAFDKGPSSAAKTIGKVVNTPGIKQTLGALDRGRAVVAAGSKQAAIGLDQVLQNKDPRTLSWSEFKSDVDKHIGFGEVYADLQRAELQASGKESEGVFGVDALGAHLTPDKQGIRYNSGAARGLAITVGAAGDIAGDPLTYVGTGTPKLAKAGLQTLEKEGLGEVATLIRQKGWKALDETQQAAVREVLTATKDPAAKAVARSGAEAVTERQIAQIEKAGRSGLKVGGRTVVPRYPGAAEEAAKSAKSQVVSKVATSEIQAGDHLAGELAGSVVRDYDHGSRLLTIEPNEAMAVVRKDGPVIARPGTFREGDAFLDGNAKVLRVLDDGTLELKLDNQLESIERPFDIIPRYKVREGQGTLFGTKEVPAPPPVYQQGTLLSSRNEIDNAIEKVKAAPSATDAGGYGAVVERQIPAEPGVHVIDDGAGGKIIGIRNAEGKLDGYLMATDDAINTFENVSGTPGVGQELLHAAQEEAGLDVAKLLANSDFTDAGRKSALNWLEEARGTLAGRVDTASSYRRTKGGGVEPARLFRVRDGKYVTKDGEVIVENMAPTRRLPIPEGGTRADAHLANSGREIGTVVGRENGNLILRPADGITAEVGDIVPGTYGKLVEKRADGTWVIKADPTLFKKTALDAAKLAPPGSEAAAALALDPDNPAALASKGYAEKHGAELGISEPVPVPANVKADPALAKRMADFYANAPRVDPAAEASFRQMAKEVEQQFKYLTEDLGIKVEFVADNPYATHAEMIDDLVKNKRLKVLKSETHVGADFHPFMTVEQNDQFRAVHDFFGHAAQRNSFSRDGEEIAWRIHSQMFSEGARPAMTSETRLQNSYLNFSDANEARRAQGLEAEFGPQKALLPPPEFMEIPEAAVSPAAASNPLSATTPTPGVLEGQGALFPEASAADSGVGAVGEAQLPNIDPYGPRPTVTKDTAKVEVGTLKVDTPDPEDQLKLFDMGIVPTRDLKAGDRARGLGGVVQENLGRRQVVVKMDDAPQLVIRDGEVMRLDAADLGKGDILSDSGMTVVRRNEDGTLVLKGHVPLGARRIGEQVELGGLKQTPALRDKIPGVRSVRDAFAPRASVAAGERAGNAPVGAARFLGEVQAGERARLGNALNDMQLRLHSVESRLRKSLGRQEADAVIREAFDVGKGEGSKASELAAELRSKADTLADPKRAAAHRTAADAIDTMIQLRAEIQTIQTPRAVRSAVEQGDLGLEQLGGLKFGNRTPVSPDQMPLVLSKQGKKLLMLQPEIKNALGIERQLEHLSQGFDFSERAGRGIIRIEDPTVAKALGEKGSFIEIDLSRPAVEINERISAAINESARRSLKLGDNETFKLFEENPLTAYSYRNRTAQTVAIEADMMKNAEELGLVKRTVLPKATDAAGQAAHAQFQSTLPEGWVEVKGWGTPGEVTYAPEAVAKEMSKVRAIITNDEELRGFKKIVDQAGALWTRQVLSPITKGFGQQMRNLQSNLINATFGGLTLDGQKEAIRLQTGALRQAGKLMKTEGLSFDAALAKLGLEAGGRDATLLRYLREDDILNTGLYRVLDWGDTTSDTLTSGLKERVAKRVNPLSSRNVLFAPGRVVNTAIEDNGRMALYISVFDKTGSREAAREAVAKYLFDYADLTTFESHVMKNVNAFYTYMRKNTALQIKLMAERPALPLTTLKAKAALADDNQDLLKEGELGGRGLFQAGPALQGVIGGKGVVGIDDPVTAAIRTIDPFIQAAYLTLDKASGGKLMASVPETERPTLSSIAKGGVGLTAGAPAEFLTTLAEVALGKDIRTDRELTESDSWQKLVSAVAPVWDQGVTLEKMATGDDSIDLRTNLLRMLAGISAYRRDTDQAAYSLNYAMLNELEETIKLLKAKGVDVPTIEDLRTIGLIPEAGSVAEPRKVPLTKEQKQAEIRKRLGQK